MDANAKGPERLSEAVDTSHVAAESGEMLVLKR